MIVELVVPENKTMSYTLTCDVQHIICRIGSGARLTVLHAPQQKITGLQQAYFLQKESYLEMHGWYEHAIDAHLEVILQGASSHADIKLGFKGDADETAQFNTVQRHEAQHTISSLKCKSLLTDQAQMKHVGMIHVTEQAVNTDAALYSNHMLLSSRAYAHVQPNLEVLTDEVRCAHGSAIGMFDADMLFYMQSRGLDTMSAKQLLEEAFFAEVR